jgi:hypothetical protein
MLNVESQKIIRSHWFSEGETMRAIKEICFIGLLVITGVFVQNALALPASLFVDEDGKRWEGYKTYKHDDFDMTVEWAVYDTSIQTNPWAGQVTFPDQYIYAYQLFNGASSVDISYFSLLDKDGDPILESKMHATQAVADEAQQGIMPADNPSVKQGTWRWTMESGLIVVGGRSVYLVLSSAHGPTRGSFKVESESENPVPGSPEPATIALFGSAVALLASKRNRKRCSA